MSICIWLKVRHLTKENQKFMQVFRSRYIIGIVAFACRLSFQRGFEGNVSFISKTQLIDHYTKTLGAIHFGGHIMIIDTPAALHLINKYFKNQAP